jgi:glycine cleavage system aminomethyltransferase T
MGFDPKNIVTDYGDPEDEARACRQSAALFDFSFMSRATISGHRARAVIGTITIRPLDDLPVGRIRYALRETPKGHLAADLTIWRIAPDTWEVMSGRPVDIADLTAAAESEPETEVHDLTASTSIFAVQGPEALAALRPLLSPTDVQRLAQVPYYGTVDVTLADVPARIGRLGYTGERGFEVLVPAAAGRAMWEALAARARPAGFIAADMLRIEAGFVLFANEFQLPVTAAEAGLAGFATTSNNTGADALSLVAFRAAAQTGITLFQPRAALNRPTEPDVLVATSACNSLAAGGALGLGYVRRDHPAHAALRDSTGTFADIELVAHPFVDPDKRRPRGAWSKWD